jgi:hypothetical protein
MADNNEALQLFNYVPSKKLAIVAMIIFGLFSIYLATRINLSKSAKFLYILPVIAFMEFIGYLYRLVCSDSTTLAKYIIMTLFLILPANVLSLINYIAVGKIIRLSNIQTDRFYLRPNFVNWFFFASEIVSFWLQRACDFKSSPQSNNIGIAIILIIVSIQSMLFTCFLVITVYIHQNPAYNYHVDGQPNAKGKVFACVYVTFGLLYIRSIYRVTEYVTGYGGPIASTEWAFYVFDALTVGLCFLVYSSLFIGDYLPSKTNTKKQQYSRVSDLDQDEADGLAENNKNVAVFNNVQSVNYSISLDP